MTTEPSHHEEPREFGRHHFDETLAEIVKGLVEMGSAVTENVRRAGHAMLERRLDLVDVVRNADNEVNARYIALERKIFTTLALQQPVARDLRFLVAATRMVYELERSGDLAVNLVNDLERQDGFPDSPRLMGRLEEIVNETTALFARGIDAIADMTPDAGAVLDAADDAVDNAVSEFYTEIGAESAELGLETAIALTRVGRFLERIADHAVNLGEQVTYIVTGELLEDENADPWGEDSA
jgi:phosphate transport system protein